MFFIVTHVNDTGPMGLLFRSKAVGNLVIKNYTQNGIYNGVLDLLPYLG